MLIAFVLLVACDDTVFEPGTESTTPDTADWCGVERVLTNQCATCHSAASPSGGLDLETDPYGAIVDVEAPGGGVLVVPGDADSSVLYQRMAGLSGGIMPPGGALDDGVVENVAAWITDGATTDCTGTGTGTTTWTGTGEYHPEGWDDPSIHGMALKFQTETDCRACHGDDLLGGSGPACESCHGAGWESNCLWCHGGEDSTTGAPPEGIDDTTGPQLDTFVPHTPHLDSDIAVVACERCHDVPTDALTPGHVFDDDTAGLAEVVILGGSWTSPTCTNYCHGDGQGNGSVDHTDDPRSCSSCHADRGTPARWASMSGDHVKHLLEGFQCDECHSPTVSGSNTIVDATLHVNGVPDLDLGDISFDGSTCTGSCHGENHNGRTW